MNFNLRNEVILEIKADVFQYYPPNVDSIYLKESGV